jgi:hypothetical protein
VGTEAILSVDSGASFSIPDTHVVMAPAASNESTVTTEECLLQACCSQVN